MKCEWKEQVCLLEPKNQRKQCEFTSWTVNLYSFKSPRENNRMWIQREFSWKGQVKEGITVHMGAAAWSSCLGTDGGSCGEQQRVYNTGGKIQIPISTFTKTSRAILLWLTRVHYLFPSANEAECFSFSGIFGLSYTETDKLQVWQRQTVSHNCFYYTSKPECAIPDDKAKTIKWDDAMMLQWYRWVKNGVTQGWHWWIWREKILWFGGNKSFALTQRKGFQGMLTSASSFWIVHDSISK